MQPLISLIICTLNREQELVRCLTSALNQSDKSYEIILVDQTDHHEEATSTFLSQNSSKIRIVRSQVKSLTKARNLGVKSSLGSLVIMVDDDTELPPDFISEYRKAFSLADVIQGRIVESDSINHPRPGWLYPWIKIKGGDNCAYSGPTNTVTGANFGFHREVFDKIGGFDENFQGIAAREDSDFGYRAYKAKFRMLYWPAAKLLHFKSNQGGVESGKDNLYFFKDSYYRSELYFARKHFSKLAIWLYKIRLLIRGYKRLKNLIDEADQQARDLLNKS